MKNILKYLVMVLSLAVLSACGGGGGGGGGGGAATPATALLKIVMTGTLPAATAISGAGFTLTLPANVTPATVNGTAATGVVVNSGTFAGSTIPPQVVYTPATAGVPGTLGIILVSSDAAGLSQAGEVAAITLRLANGEAPAVGSFGVGGVSVIDAAIGQPIAGMNVVVANVTLQ